MNEIFAMLEQACRKTFADWFHPVQHADVVIQIPPVWANAKTIRALTGLNREQLNQMAIDGKVVAKKIGKTVVYKYQDVLDAIDGCPER